MLKSLQKTKRNKSPNICKVDNLDNDEKSEIKTERKSQNSNDDASQDNKADTEDNETQGENKYAGKPKPYLKRKTRGVKFQKLDWKNVKSRTDCWGKKSARQENQDQSEKSIPAVVKYQKNKKKAPEQATKMKKSKNLKNIQSRIDTGIRKDVRNYMYEEANDSFDYNQYNLGEYANEDLNYLQSNEHKLEPDSRRFEFNQNRQDMMDRNNQDAENETHSYHETFDELYSQNDDKAELRANNIDLMNHHPIVQMQNQDRYTNEIEYELGEFSTIINFDNL